MERYNGRLKAEFIDNLIESGKSYSQAYDRLFDITSVFEQIHSKDLLEFNSEDILVVFKSVASKMKYTTVMSYNSLIKAYKDWGVERGYEVVDEICTVDELKSIKGYKKYVILNDDDVLDITQYLDIDGGDWNIALFLKLFWEIDGQEDLKDVLRLKIQDVVDNTVTLYNSKTNKKTTYEISYWLAEAITEYAEMTQLEFNKIGRKKGNKQGFYPIKTALENGGYVFRMSYTVRTKVGVPLDGVKFSNTLYQFCQRNTRETLTISDIQMSLALRDMVKNKKTPQEMYTQKRYFANLPSSVYANVFTEYAKEKWEDEYAKYVEYYNMITEKFAK